MSPCLVLITAILYLDNGQIVSPSWSVLEYEDATNQTLTILNEKWQKHFGVREVGTIIYDRRHCGYADEPIVKKK